MQKFTRKIAIITAVSAAAILSGCSDDTPSESAIERQIAERFSDCQLLSVEGFEKVNGFPQQEGSYVWEIKYTAVMKPIGKNVEIVKDYLPQRDKLTQYVEDNREKVSSLVSKLNSMRTDCIKKRDDLGEDKPLPSSVTEDYAAVREIDGRISAYNNKISELKIRLLASKNTLEYIRGEPSGIALAQTYETEIADLIAKRDAESPGLATAKQKTLDDEVQLRTERLALQDENKACFEEIARTSQENSDLLNGEQKLARLREDALKPLKANLMEKCHNISISGVMAGFSDDDVENYGKTLKRQISGRIRLIKSDKGWVVG